MDTNQIWKTISEGVFVIAEIGKGFIQTEEDQPVEVYLENAKKLALAAKESGATAVKFQTHNVEDEQLNINVTAPHFKGADRYSWVKRNTEATPFDTFWVPLKQYCDEIGILFHSTPMSRGAAEILTKLDVQLWKVGSGDILDFVMLDYLARTKKPIIISSGMTTPEELAKAVKFLKDRNAQFALLHCVSQYPCPPEQLNLGTISYFKEQFDVPVGFSDHSIEVDTARQACALGATIIEKHFSFSRDLWGSDHKVSLTPEEFSVMTSKIASDRENGYQDVKLDEVIIGNKEKTLNDGESQFRPLFRKSLMWARDIEAGEIVAPEDLYAMRPQEFAGGAHSERYEEAVGKTTSASHKRFDPVILAELQ